MLKDKSMNEHQTRIYALARNVWQSDMDADQFMAKPHALLAGISPYECAATEDGAAKVEGILQNLVWGLPR